jgi:restriction system protein
MTSVWCVRAGGGDFAEQFLSGGFVGIGWREITEDLGGVSNREQLFAIVRRYFPDIQSAILLSNYVSEIHRFLLEIQPGDYIIIPSRDAEYIDYGTVDPGLPYYYAAGDDGCPYRHRRPVTWAREKIRLKDLPTPLLNSISALLAAPANTRMHSLLTVFWVEHKDEFITAIGQKIVASVEPATRVASHRVVLEQLMQLKAAEFEHLITHLLAAMGFEDCRRIGSNHPRQESFDVFARISISMLARIKVFARFHRSNLGSMISAESVRELRQVIPYDGQGVFVSTADFQPAAAETAREDGFPRITLVDGQQLADLLTRHWSHIPAEIRDRLALEQGLVKS